MTYEIGDEIIIHEGTKCCFITGLLLEPQYTTFKYTAKGMVVDVKEDNIAVSVGKRGFIINIDPKDLIVHEK